MKEEGGFLQDLSIDLLFSPAVLKYEDIEAKQLVQLLRFFFFFLGFNKNVNIKLITKCNCSKRP